MFPLRSMLLKPGTGGCGAIEKPPSRTASKKKKQSGDGGDSPLPLIIAEAGGEQDA